MYTKQQLKRLQKDTHTHHLPYEDLMVLFDRIPCSTCTSNVVLVDSLGIELKLTAHEYANVLNYLGEALSLTFAQIPIGCYFEHDGSVFMKLNDDVSLNSIRLKDNSGTIGTFLLDRVVHVINDLQDYFG